MSTVTREEQIRDHNQDAARRLSRLGERLAKRQEPEGPTRGNVSPWAGCDDADFHGTLAAMWIWVRAGKLTDSLRFVPNVSAGWAFVKAAWPRFIPSALTPADSEEAAYDCAMVLRVALADLEWDRHGSRLLVEASGRLLAAHLSDLDELAGREFRDPGFLVWTLAEFARATNDRGLLTSARRFADRAFGMKSPPPFASEPTLSEGLFDFSSTTATRVMAVIAAEGATPFVGAWLRERVAPMAPRGFVARPLDENVWNACAAAALGRAFLVATDPALLQSHTVVLSELSRRDDAGNGIGRQSGFPSETCASFYYALALDALARS